MNNTTDLLAVIGHPIGHSLSPAMHNAAIKALGLKAVYTAIDVRPETLAQAIDGLRVMGFRGVNLTIPHKEAVIPLLDDITDVARRMGAVNTVFRDSDRLIGDNTDGAGWRQSFEEELKMRVSGMRAAVIGAGGAAKGIVDSLLAGGCEKVIVYNRHITRAEELVVQLRGFYDANRLAAMDMKDLETNKADLLVQTTPVGMAGHLEGILPVPRSCLHSELIVSDIVYRPLHTALLCAAKEEGARIHTGLGMLVHQGALAFTRWYGAYPSVDIMRDAALQAL